MSARVVVVESHPVTRWGIRQLLDGQSDLAVVGEAHSPREAVTLTAVEMPDVITIGLPASESHGLPLARELRDRFEGLGVVLLAASDDDDVLLEAFELGISAFVPKSAPVAEVVAAVRHAAVSASSFISCGLAAALRRRDSAPICDLSARERQVLALLVSGASVPAIAVMLRISPSTAKTYVSRVYDKLDVRNRAEAVMAAVRLGLADRPTIPAPRAPLATATV